MQTVKNCSANLFLIYKEAICLFLISGEVCDAKLITLLEYAKTLARLTQKTYKTSSKLKSPTIYKVHIYFERVIKCIRAVYYSLYK